MKSLGDLHVTFCSIRTSYSNQLTALDVDRNKDSELHRCVTAVPFRVPCKSKKSIRRQVKEETRQKIRSTVTGIVIGFLIFRSTPSRSVVPILEGQLGTTRRPVLAIRIAILRYGLDSTREERRSRRRHSSVPVRTKSSSLRAPWTMVAHAFQRAKVTILAKHLPFPLLCYPPVPLISFQFISRHFLLNMADASDLPPSPLQEDAVQESSHSLVTAFKLVAASLLLISAVTKYSSNNNSTSSSSSTSHAHRRLALVGDAIPTYMNDLLEELKERKRLMEETPPEEVKYWFEYTGPLQVRKCRSISTTREICTCNNCRARGPFDGFFSIENGEMRNSYIL